MRTLGLFLLLAAPVKAQDYPLGPDSQVQASSPKGTVSKAILPPGVFYPGTPHNYSIYVPAQYVATKPTPVMIFLDGSGALGNGMRMPTVLDNLIAKHEIPPMIGIFVDPGVLPVIAGDSQNRFERIFEYDSISSRYASFLLEELIPAVDKHYNLSKSPDDRALYGVSTGAVGAFVAAWNRPDQFHRVLSLIGTFVAMKGADSLPALIRKTEPKPLRVFLQDGRNDHIVADEPFGTFFAGSWPINNQVMYEAFQSAGYDVKLTIGEGGHDTRQGGAIMPDALRWLWRGYPAPITVHEPASMTQPGWDPRGKVYATVWADKPWEPVGSGYGALSAPAGDRDGNVFFADAAANRIYKVDAAGKIAIFKSASQGASALAAGPDGRLYASQPGKQRIVSYGPAGDEKSVAENVSANSLAITARGDIYFSDGVHKSVRMVDARGHAQDVFHSGELADPVGVALSPDQAMLIVTDAHSRYSWSLQINTDGHLVNGEPFYRLELPEFGPATGAIGAAEDSSGQVYFATALGIQVCEANGRHAMILNPPEPGSIGGFTFAGKDLNWLYVSEGGKLFRRPVKVNGTAAWAPNKPPKPPL